MPRKNLKNVLVFSYKRFLIPNDDHKRVLDSSVISVMIGRVSALWLALLQILREVSDVLC